MMGSQRHCWHWLQQHHGLVGDRYIHLFTLLCWQIANILDLHSMNFGTGGIEKNMEKKVMFGSHKEVLSYGKVLMNVSIMAESIIQKTMNSQWRCWHWSW